MRIVNVKKKINSKKLALTIVTIVFLIVGVVFSTVGYSIIGNTYSKEAYTEIGDYNFKYNRIEIKKHRKKVGKRMRTSYRYAPVYTGIVLDGTHAYRVKSKSTESSAKEFARNNPYIEVTAFSYLDSDTYEDKVLIIDANDNLERYLENKKIIGYIFMGAGFIFLLILLGLRIFIRIKNK